MYRDAHRVVKMVYIGVLIEVVANARPVVQQVAQGHPIVDQRQLVTKQVADALIKLDESVSDRRQHTDRGERLGAAGDSETMLNGVRDTAARSAKP